MFYIWTLFWTLLLGHMVNYVAGAVSGATYDFMEATYLGIAFAVLFTLFLQFC